MPELFNRQPLSLFSSFCRNPFGVTFQTQEDDEHIILFTRKHFIPNLSWILFAIFLIFLPPLLLAFRSFSVGESIFPFPLPTSYSLILALLYYVLVFSYVFTQFITWYYTVSLVTNKRIVDIDFFYLLYHDVAVTKLDLVEDVNYTKTGFFSSFFNFGDVFVQTAGKHGHFDFLQIPKPEIAVEIIGELIGKKT